MNKLILILLTTLFLSALFGCKTPRLHKHNNDIEYIISLSDNKKYLNFNIHNNSNHDIKFEYPASINVPLLVFHSDTITNEIIYEMNSHYSFTVNSNDTLSFESCLSDFFTNFSDYHHFKIQIYDRNIDLYSNKVNIETIVNCKYLTPIESISIEHSVWDNVEKSTLIKVNNLSEISPLKFTRSDSNFILTIYNNDIEIGKEYFSINESEKIMPREGYILKFSKQKYLQKTNDEINDLRYELSIPEYKEFSYSSNF